jgi:hypothetical protein
MSIAAKCTCGKQLYYCGRDCPNTNKLHYLDVSLINKEAIEFADYLLGNFEMSEFEKEHPKYKVDEELCWQLAGTKQKYTSKEMYEMFISEKNN